RHPRRARRPLPPTRRRRLRPGARPDGALACLLRADVRPSRHRRDVRHLAAAGARRRLPERGQAARMTALLDHIPHVSIAERHRPFPRATVGEEGWGAAIDLLADGRATLFGLWGDAGAVHMALL